MESAEIEHLLAALDSGPEVYPHDHGLLIDGYLLQGSEETVRIIVGSLLLELSIDDILSVIDVEQQDSDTSSLAVPVRVTAKRGARLLDCTPADEYKPLLERPVEPFAYIVRKNYPPMQDAPRFREREQAYRLKHGLE